MYKEIWETPHCYYGEGEEFKTSAEAMKKTMLELFNLLQRISSEDKLLDGEPRVITTAESIYTQVPVKWY